MMGGIVVSLDINVGMAALPPKQCRTIGVIFFMLSVLITSNEKKLQNYLAFKK